MFLPHIKLNHVAPVASVATVEPIRAASTAADAPTRGGFLGSQPEPVAPGRAAWVAAHIPAPVRPSVLSTAAADGFRETEYRCDVNEVALYYRHDSAGLWRFYVYHMDSDRFACVGLQYSTKRDLIADLPRYAAQWGFPAPPLENFLTDAAPAAEPLPEPEPLAVSEYASQFMRGDSDDTFDDFERRESAAIMFGRQLEASRVATIQDVRYTIEPAATGSGFQINVTGADGMTETIVSGIYGFSFDTFGRTLGYAVQRARDRFVCHTETLQNETQIERRYHKRRNVWVYVVTLPEPLSGSRFKTEETRAKRDGGWYAREYKPEFQRGGFMFLDLQSADRYASDYRPSGNVATLRRSGATLEQPEPPETPSGGFLPAADFLAPQS